MYENTQHNESLTYCINVNSSIYIVDCFTKLQCETLLPYEKRKIKLSNEMLLSFVYTIALPREMQNKVNKSNTILRTLLQSGFGIAIPEGVCFTLI